MTGRLRLAITVSAAGIVGRAESIAAHGLDVDRYAQIARRAEAAALDAVFLPDSPAHEPTTLLAALAAVTDRIGLIGTLSAAHNDPLELARRVADTDYLSSGRIGWRVAENELAGRLYGTGPESFPDRSAFVDSVLRRWHDRTELRSPQGHPVVVRGSGDADVVLVDGRGIHDHRQGLREALRAQGRDPDSVVVLQNIAVVLSATDAEAEEIAPALDDLDTGGHAVVAGTPIRVADELEERLRQGRADGFNVLPDVLPSGFDAFTEHLLPELRRRGLFRTGYESRTLRGHLGLAIPAGADSPQVRTASLTARSRRPVTA
ncbi:LLM class flavin-dependent oxidoreductase [Kineosporia sp. NBRC 101731]|uniref:LLM class flavin-dependent oxidoreductase n=1 Tax=Kineosporia sp. NBRC 101731 TaxID=3032199 RepID=UPI0024A29E66|nr:LLM class flavin-dependent oxidoreductase [Kineosporia sp. NBRC 101731]GLY33506.1 hypothetical protein Kisp02_68710 [Kineosporia sp. NBRC 101731]